MSNKATYNLDLAYILTHIYTLTKKLDTRYNKFIDNVVLHRFIKHKYDNRHTIISIYAILNIRISTIEYEDSKFVIVYKDEKCISTLTIVNNKPILGDVKCILCIEYLDDLKIKNTIAVFNCGVIVHGNCYTKHIYNYKGERRNL